MGMGSVHVSTPERRDRLWLINGLAVVLLTLLGAASEAVGYDRMLKTNTSKRREHSLFRQGCMVYDLIPTMPERWLQPLMLAFTRLLDQQPLFSRTLPVLARCFAAHLLWYLGYPNRALETMGEALSQAREMAHPFSLAPALEVHAVLAERGLVLFKPQILKPVRDVHRRSSAQWGRWSLAEQWLRQPRPVQVVNSSPGRPPIPPQMTCVDYPSSARRDFASCKSLVSKPSVNQP